MCAKKIITLDTKSLEFDDLTCEKDGIIYHPISINVALKNMELIDPEMMIPLSKNKLIKVEHLEENIQEVLENYQSKALKFIF